MARDVAPHVIREVGRGFDECETFCGPGWRIMWLRTEKCAGCPVYSSIERLQVALPECNEPVLTWTLV